MSLGTREIKRRIKSVGNTKKITKAMELVAAVKMRKSVDAVLATRAYSNAAWEIIQDLSVKTDPRHHALLQKRDTIKRIGVVLLASNRGLCGGFNREVVEKLVAQLKKEKEQNADVAVEILLMGKRGSDIMHKHGYKVVADFQKADVAVSITEVTVISKMVIADFMNKKYDRVLLAYADFKSAISQKANVRKLLPIEQEDEELGHVNRAEKKENPSTSSRSGLKAGASRDFEYTFEPSPDAVLDQMLYRLIELQIYQALLESNASEHSARMMAMRSASDAAGDMIDDLTLTFNQARQQAITSELADISAGSAAIT